MLESFIEKSGIWGQRLSQCFTKQCVGPQRSTMASERDSLNRATLKKVVKWREQRWLCQWGKEEGWYFSLRSREINFSVTPNKIITYLQSWSLDSNFQGKHKTTPRSWGLECFQLITERETFSSAQNITWLEGGEAGVCKSDHILHFCTSTKAVGLEQCLKFLLFYRNLLCNEKNEAAHGVKSHLSIQMQVFLTQHGAHNSFMLVSMERTTLAKASLGLEKIVFILPRSIKAGPSCNIGKIKVSTDKCYFKITPNLHLYNVICSLANGNQETGVCLHVSTWVQGCLSKSIYTMRGTAEFSCPWHIL